MAVCGNTRPWLSGAKAMYANELPTQNDVAPRATTRKASHEQKTLLAAIAESRSEEDQQEECNCGELIDFPCWPCVRDGKKELPGETQ